MPRKPGQTKDTPVDQRAKMPPRVSNLHGSETILTPELQEKILSWISKGNYIETSVAACGIAKQTFHQWLKKGALGQEPYKGFSDAVQKARSECEADAVGTIRDQKAWQAKAWWLERSFSDRFGYKSKVEHSGNIGKFVESFLEDDENTEKGDSEE